MLEGQAEHFEEYLGMISLYEVSGEVRMELPVWKSLMAPNGFLHAGSIVSLAESAVERGVLASLPAGATGFATIESKSNHLGTAREGILDCSAKAVHLGRTTQVWEAVVSVRGTGKVLALYRCTQVLFYEKIPACLNLHKTGSRRERKEIKRKEANHLPDYLGVVIHKLEKGETAMELPVSQCLLNPNGILHGGMIIALADTATGYGTFGSLPPDAANFTTVELKNNFMGTAEDGILDCTARAVHMGKTTQIWDAVVTHRETDKILALYRCTQLILYR